MTTTADARGCLSLHAVIHRDVCTGFPSAFVPVVVTVRVLPWPTRYMWAVYSAEPGMIRIVPWKHTLLVPNEHGVIVSKVTCVREPIIHPSVITPLSTADPLVLLP